MISAKKIRIQIKQVNFSYQIIDKTLSTPQLLAWPNSLEKAIEIIREEYKGKKVEIIESDLDYLSPSNKKKIKEGLKDLLEKL